MNSILLFQFIMVFYFIEYDGMEYNHYQYPKWAEGIGWVIVVVVLALIPGGMIVQCWRKVGTCQVSMLQYLSVCLSVSVSPSLSQSLSPLPPLSLSCLS